MTGKPLTSTPRPVDSAAATSSPYAGALEFLYDRINYERLTSGTTRYPFRLQRMRHLLRQLGLASYLHADCPVPKVPTIHVAGTKGKGSMAAMVSAVLTAAGLRTGLYTSPHLFRLEERFRIDGRPCSPDDLVSLVQRVRPIAAACSPEVGNPSFFELTTAMALLHFDASDCEAVVLEVGLGGRLDSTNVCSPSVSAITAIGLDHQQVLGHDVGKIAAEKAGIIKPGVPVVSGVDDGEAAEVIAAQAAARHASLYQHGRDFRFDSAPQPVWGSSLRYHGITAPLGQQESAELSMEGVHQCRNAAVAIAAIQLLRDQGVAVGSDAIRRGLGDLQCVGRMERFRLPDGVIAIVDAAHNQDSIAALCDCLEDRSVDHPVCVVFGTSRDKSAEVMLRQLAQQADRLVLTRFRGNPRFRPPEELLPLVPEKLVDQTTVVDDPIAACRLGHEVAAPGGTLVICGSFFLVAETHHWVSSRVNQ